MIAAEVGRNDKQRHQFWDDNQNKIRGIRAVQGHDANVVAVEKVMVKIGITNKPQHLMHLTFRESIDGIIKSGLIPGGGRKSREMNHFSPFRYGDPRILAGARFNAPIETIWDVDAILQNENISLYWTDSHAVCSMETIPSSYLVKAINIHTGFVIYDRAAVVDKEAKIKALGNEEQARQYKQQQEVKETPRPEASSSSSAPPIEEAQYEDSPRQSEKAKEPEPETTGEQDHDNAESFEDGVDFDISEAEDAGQNDEERCSECTAIVSPGVLRCLECGHELHQQPPDAEDNSKQLADISKEMKESFDAVVNHIEKLKRNPYPSRAAKLKRAIKDYDKKARKGKKNQSGQVIKYSGYEERYAKDEAFRLNMLKCRPPRDLTFRSLATSLEVQFKPKTSWQRGLIENERHKRSREEGGSESTGEAKGRGKGWQSSHSAQQRTGAGW
jgi:RNA:NAD 2'-phosphotransferase (TPT1/KptA family)